ncbi:MAG TPA: hypothetical protein VJU80_04990 [Solirubrobacteraceae bacterium]|nr:hypothetical protein [Solirubrobacteraceae bacterium]
MAQRITVHQDHRHGSVPASVERLLAAMVSFEVCRKLSTQVVVELDDRILRFAMRDPRDRSCRTDRGALTRVTRVGRVRTPR